MDTKEIEKRDAQPWVPMSNPTDVKIIGKFIEELNELSGALSRALIQGIHEKHTDHEGTNLNHIVDEMGDVENMFSFFKARFMDAYDRSQLLQRAELKRNFLKNWLTNLPHDSTSINPPTA